MLVVVDAQPGFFAYDALSEADATEAADAVTRIAWMAALATLLDVPAVVVEEGPDRNGHTDPRILERVPAGTPTVEKQTFGLTACEEAVEAIRATGRGTAVVVGLHKGLTFEWLHTVDRAIDTFPQAAALGTPPWRL